MSTLVKTRVLDATDTEPKRIKATGPGGATLTEGYFTAASNAEGLERHAEVALALMKSVTPDVGYAWHVSETRANGYTIALREVSGGTDILI